jgi:hypothetical protein
VNSLARSWNFYLSCPSPLAHAGVGFGDMSGDGQADLLVHSGPLPGFFETTSDGT